MAGGVEHLESPGAAVEDPIGIFHAGVEARLADAQERSDKRPEVKGVGWNCGRNLRKKTGQDGEKNLQRCHGRKPNGEAVQV